MAVYNNTSAAGNVSWSSMDTWSTEYSSNSNISWRIVAQACIPADSVFPLTNNYSISDLIHKDGKNLDKIVGEILNKI